MSLRFPCLIPRVEKFFSTSPQVKKNQWVEGGGWANGAINVGCGKTEIAWNS